MSNSIFIQLAPSVYVPLEDVKTFSVSPMGANPQARRGVLDLNNGLIYILEQWSPYSSITITSPDGDILEVRVRDDAMFERGFDRLSRAKACGLFEADEQHVNILTEDVVRAVLAPIFEAMDAVTEPEQQEMSSVEEDMDSSSDWEPTKQGRRPPHIGRRRAREAARLRAERDAKKAAAEEKADPTWAPPRPRRSSAKKSYDSDSDWEPTPKRRRTSETSWVAAYEREEARLRQIHDDAIESALEKWRQDCAERQDSYMTRRNSK